MMQLHNTRAKPEKRRQPTRCDSLYPLYPLRLGYVTGIGKNFWPDLRRLLRSVRKPIYRVAERW
jgi:hypothetical protein